MIDKMAFIACIRRATRTLEEASKKKMLRWKTTVPYKYTVSTQEERALWALEHKAKLKINTLIDIKRNLPTARGVEKWE